MQSLESLQIAKHPQKLKISQNPTDVFFRLLKPRSENLETSLFRGHLRNSYRNYPIYSSPLFTRSASISTCEHVDHSQPEVRFLGVLRSRRRKVKSPMSTGYPLVINTELMLINGGDLMANSELMVINLLVMTVTVCELEAMAQSK